MLFVLLGLRFALAQAQSVSLDSSVLTQDCVYLEKSSFTVMNALSMLDCAAECSFRSQCLSFGFEPKNQSCHQQSQKSTSTADDVAEKAKWLHSNMVLMLKIFCEQRSDHCITRRMCSRKTSFKKALCVKDEAFIPPGYCPEPDTRRNADISSGNQQKGTNRTYTCNHGYLDTSLDDDTAVTTCMADGKWSTVVLNCTGPYISLETRALRTNKFTRIPPETLSKFTGSTLVFLVKTCHDATFRLHIKPHPMMTTDQFEIVIGGLQNKLSMISQCSVHSNTLITQHIERNLVSCKEFKPFWLSWKNGTIFVGKGTVIGESIFMKHKPIVPLIVKSVRVSSFSQNAGAWLFYQQI